MNLWPKQINVSEMAILITVTVYVLKDKPLTGNYQATGYYQNEDDGPSLKDGDRLTIMNKGMMSEGIDLLVIYQWCYTCLFEDGPVISADVSLCISINKLLDYDHAQVLWRKTNHHQPLSNECVCVQCTGGYWLVEEWTTICDCFDSQVPLFSISLPQSTLLHLSLTVHLLNGTP